MLGEDVLISNTFFICLIWIFDGEYNLKPFIISQTLKETSRSAEKMETMVRKLQQKYKKAREDMGKWDELQSRLLSLFKSATSIINRLQVVFFLWPLFSLYFIYFITTTDVASCSILIWLFHSLPSFLPIRLLLSLFQKKWLFSPTRREDLVFICRVVTRYSLLEFTWSIQFVEWLT